MARETLPQRVTDALLGRLEELLPSTVRRLVGARRRVNAKGMGLFAAAFLDLERVEGRQRSIRGEPAADQCFEWLEENRVETGGGIGWGYPFDWRSRVLIPRNTPTVVTSAFIGDAYWLRYLYRRDAGALHRCEDVCRFILGGLNRSPSAPDGAFCFSYSPVDHFQVHNANLLAAEFLIRVGTEVRRAGWVETGLNAGRFTLSQIREDGTLDYWSADQSKGSQQDLFHSGFEIRMLDAIARTTGRDDFRRAADRYLEAWLGEYFDGDGTPRFARERPGAVEVHSCAEALLCAAQLAGRPALPSDALAGHLERSLEGAVRYLWVSEGRDAGYFAWISQPRYGMRMRTAIPMIRWGQAWMLRAMASSLLALQVGR